MEDACLFVTLALSSEGDAYEVYLQLKRSIF